MVKLQFFLQTGSILNLKTPVTFNEKLQAYKLSYRNDEMLKLTDKVCAREYVKEKGLENILVPLKQVWNDWKEIDFDSLPEKFVIKTSDGGGGNEVMICRDKTKLDKRNFEDRIKRWMSFPKPKKHIAREWAYQNKFSRKLILEELLEEDGDKGLNDYKFLCFNGKYRCLWVDKDRFGKHQRGFWDENFNFLPKVSCDYPVMDKELKLPANIGEMKIIAEKLAEDFPFARIDLYNVDNKIYFSEITFYPNSGYKLFIPSSFDLMLGLFFDFPKNY